MPRLPAIFIAAALCLAAIAAPLLAQSQNGPSTPWRDALDRVERNLDDIFDAVTGLDRVPPPQVGLYVPASNAPEDAAAPPADWVPLLGQHSTQPPPRRMVLLVHGLDEAGDIWTELAPALLNAGHKVARFEYPNDQRIHASAELLLEHLRAARAAGLEELAVVAHSMGGLVTFDALTRPDGYAGNTASPTDLPRVTHFFSIGTPWNGSPWAKLQAIGEAHEQVSRLLAGDSFDIRPLLQYRRDGSGQAGDDLLPDSDLITELRARPWPANLPLTIVAGKITNPDPTTYDSIADSQILRELLGPDRLAALVADFRAATEDLGDGVVSLTSAFARQTEDTHVFPVNHRALLHNSPIDFITGQAPQGPPAIPIILDRLESNRQ
ncbi:MAG: hypothetical protein Q9O74_08765 [Planctomycetota bacterium]|nr:hypothetical protein [Planctomycetota bacterium]